MKRIGFSHNYVKLHGQNRAQLLQCKKISRDEISDDAIYYDTEYWEDDEHKFYKLDDGDYLRLILIGNKGIPFTTYRKDNAENRAKYMDAFGDIFETYVREDREV